MIFGYTRNLPSGLTNVQQTQLIESYGIEEWIHETKYHQNELLDKLIEKTVPGDKIITFSFSTVAHSPEHLLSIIEDIKIKGGTLFFHHQKINSEAPVVRMLDNQIRMFIDFQSEANSLTTESRKDAVKRERNHDRTTTHVEETIRNQ